LLHLILAGWVNHQQQLAIDYLRNLPVKTLAEILGCSPDEADALVLAVHGLLHKPQVMKAGVVTVASRMVYDDGKVVPSLNIRSTLISCYFCVTSQKDLSASKTGNWDPAKASSDIKALLRAVLTMVKVTCLGGHCGAETVMPNPTADLKGAQLACLEFLLHGVAGQDGDSDASQDGLLDGLVAAEFQGDPKVGHGESLLFQ
jgi:hypothetical protein